MTPWQTFLKATHTLGPDAGVRARWHGPRRRYAVWALPVRAPQVLARVAKLQELLAGHIDPVPLAQLHVTLWVGGFSDGDGSRNDDLDGGIRADLDRAIEAWSQPIPFQVGGVSSFLSCPFLEVKEPGSYIQALREKMGSIQLNELRFSDFIPHLTLGTYTASEDTTALIQTLSPQRALPPLTCSARPQAAWVDAPTGTLHWGQPDPGP